jgi:myo-inositol-1(or 4)-monophosphatase
MRWIIDPLDGTTNFIHGIPLYTVSIALEKDNELVVGVVFEVNLGECFYAWKNGGAWMNESRIAVSEASQLRNALCATGFPYKDFPHLTRYFDTLRFLFQNSRGVRRIGSAALDLAYVACGRFDAFYEYNLNPWDVAGGALIVKEAGGTVSDFSGGTNFLHGKEIAATNKGVYKEFLNAIVEPHEISFDCFWVKSTNLKCFEPSLPTSDFRLPTSQLLTSNFSLPTSDFRLPTSHFSLPTLDSRLTTLD